MRFVLFATLVLSAVFPARAGELPLDRNSSVVALDQRIKELTAENDDLKRRLATVQEPKGLTNEQIIHRIMRDMSVAALLRDGRSKEAVKLLESDLPAFVTFFHSSDSFSEKDIWTLHAIRNHYQKYHLHMSAEIFAALPTPYPPCNAPSVPAKP